MNEYGSFNWYMSLDDKFFNNLTKAIMYADGDNLNKLRRTFPHICEAHKIDSWVLRPTSSYPITININFNYKEEIDDYKAVDAQTGSFNQYLMKSEHFVSFLSRVIYHADEHNLILISYQYPQIIAAFNMRRGSWNMCPDGFESNTYNSIYKIPQLI